MDAEEGGGGKTAKILGVTPLGEYLDVGDVVFERSCIIYYYVGWKRQISFVCAGIADELWLGREGLHVCLQVDTWSTALPCEQNTEIVTEHSCDDGLVHSLLALPSPAIQ
jgi:hypothetical protein